MLNPRCSCGQGGESTERMSEKEKGVVAKGINLPRSIKIQCRPIEPVITRSELSDRRVRNYSVRSNKNVCTFPQKKADLARTVHAVMISTFLFQGRRWTNPDAIVPKSYGSLGNSKRRPIYAERCLDVDCCHVVFKEQHLSSFVLSVFSRRR